RVLGKTVTFFQLALLLLVIIAPRFVEPLVLIIGGLSAVSIVDYTLALARARRAARSTPETSELR
ncbi:MAG TPA: hypothetical protein VD758_06440, partial [Gemmatimonadaceae bacterium]|nr:hypothetical protein [Gemmatimonadaceae bacterium]